MALNTRSFRDSADDPPGAHYELDGRHIVDEDSFYCALGEAVNGPCGYFGWNLDALADCLCGGWGATPPFVLVWHHSQVARSHLATQKGREGAANSFFDVVTEILHEYAIEVVLR